jgi:hypothetical protein
VGTNKLFVVDRLTRAVREFPVDIRGTFDGFSTAPSRDGSTVYLVESELEADLWLLDLGAAGG